MNRTRKFECRINGADWKPCNDAPDTDPLVTVLRTYRVSYLSMDTEMGKIDVREII